jgi:hypothetical protein
MIPQLDAARPPQRPLPEPEAEAGVTARADRGETETGDPAATALAGHTHVEGGPSESPATPAGPTPPWGIVPGPGPRCRESKQRR